MIQLTKSLEYSRLNRVDLPTLGYPIKATVVRMASLQLFIFLHIRKYVNYFPHFLGLGQDISLMN